MKQHSHGRHDHQPSDRAHDHHRGHTHHHRSPKTTKLNRLFERGDLQLLILLRLQQAPSHGYELIKSINDLSYGVYEPSPGVIYPTLAMLEDQELIIQDPAEIGKKVYNITESGLVHLQSCEERLSLLKERLSSIKNLKGDINFSDDINEAVREFKVLMRHQLRHDQLSQTQVEKIVAIIKHATQEINYVTQAFIPNDKE